MTNLKLPTRIIPCLDVKDGRVVKGVNFKNIEDVGDVVELASKYYEQGADELTFLDISATNEGRSTMLEVVKKCADQIFIPLTVGGGVSSVDDVETLLKAGADKVSINSAAVKNRWLVSDIVSKFGSQVLVLSCDAKRTNKFNGFEVTTNGGRENTGFNLINWAYDMECFGVGEILLNSIDADGTKDGFDIEMIESVKDSLTIPVIASGGAGKKEDFLEVINKTEVDAVLAASVFHFGEITVDGLKSYLTNNNIFVRS